MSAEPGTRNHFNGVDKPIEFVLLDAHLLLGPLTPTPNTTLAEAVERIAGAK